MQYYGQDVISSSASSPYDFSINPTGNSILNQKMPSVNNFFFYNKVGNIGFIGFSGAYDFVDHEGLFEEACTWATGADLDMFIILGHWNDGMLS